MARGCAMNGTSIRAADFLGLTRVKANGADRLAAGPKSGIHHDATGARASDASPDARSSLHRTLARPPSRHAGRIMVRVLPAGGYHSLHGGCRSPPGLTDQDDALAARHACRIELREWMIDRAGNVPAGIFVRLTYVHDGARSASVRLHEFLMRNGRSAGGSHELAQEPRQHRTSLSLVTRPRPASGGLEPWQRTLDIFVSSNICNDEGWAIGPPGGGPDRLVSQRSVRSRIQDTAFPVSIAAIQPAKASRISLNTSRSLRPERAGTWKE